MGRESKRSLDRYDKMVYNWTKQGIKEVYYDYR